MNSFSGHQLLAKSIYTFTRHCCTIVLHPLYHNGRFSKFICSKKLSSVLADLFHYHSCHNNRLNIYNLVVAVQYTKEKMWGLRNSNDQMLLLCYSCGEYILLALPESLFIVSIPVCLTGVSSPTRHAPGLCEVRIYSGL